LRTEDLIAYLDGECPQEDRERIESALLEDPAAWNDLSELVQQRLLLKQVFSSSIRDQRPSTSKTQDNQIPLGHSQSDAKKSYVCKQCNKRLSESDFKQGFALDKKLLGIYCVECAEGVLNQGATANTSKQSNTSEGTIAPRLIKSPALIVAGESRGKSHHSWRLWGILAAGVLIVVGVVRFSQREVDPDVHLVTKTNPDLNAQKKRLPQIIETLPGAVVKRGAEELPVEKGMELRADDLLITGSGPPEAEKTSDTNPTPQLIVGFPGEETKVRLGRHTRFRIMDQGGGKSFELLLGSLKALVAPQPEGKPMRIRTIHDIKYEVLGTEFRLTVSKDRAHLKVYAGSVRTIGPRTPMIVKSGEETETVVLQAGLNDYDGTRDVSLESSSDPKFNVGGRHFLRIFGDGVFRIVIRFGLASIPSDATVHSATLSLYCQAKNHQRPKKGYVARLFSITRDWTEGTITGSGHRPDGATWFEYNYVDGTKTATGNWKTPGGDYDPEEIDEVPTSQIRPKTWARWAVTPLVKDWLSGRRLNHGMLILSDGEWGPELRFHSREFSMHPALRPKLVITYTLGGV